MVKLNIGCGPNIFPARGWVNYDREDMSGYLETLRSDSAVDKWPDHQRRLAESVKTGKIEFKIHDLRNGFPQHLDGDVEAIYLGQVIEHLNPIYEAPKLLKECHRMLKSGGVLRITTPDLDLLIKAYLNGQMDSFSAEQPEFYKNSDSSAQLAYIMYGACGPKCTWNYYEGHMFLYTQRSLTAFLQEAGFSDISFYRAPGQSKSSIMSEEAIDEGMSHSLAAETFR